MKKNFQYILWDLDGTLSDPMVGICSAVQYALKHFGFEVDDIRTLTPFIGPPLQQSLKEFYHFTPEQIKEAHRVYNEYFIARGMFENVMYEGIDTLLKKLRQEGKHLYVATSKPEKLAKRILEHFGLASYFDFIGGDTDNLTRSAKSEVIRYVLSENKAINPAQAIMVGDRKFDIAGAKANGIPAVGVLYGYGNREEFVEANADYIVHDLKELENLLIKGVEP